MIKRENSCNNNEGVILMQKKGFTLIEIMVVVIIVGILASLAIGNYTRVVEKGRMAESKKIMSVLRQQQYAYYLEKQVFTTSFSALGLNDLPQGACNINYFFQYGITANATNFNISSVRCIAGGKTPNCPAGYRIQLADNGTFIYNDTNYV